MRDEASNCTPCTEQQQSRLSRRAFLRALSTTVVGGLLAACRSADLPEQQSTLLSSAMPQPILPSPQPPSAATATPQAEELPLAEFLALSAVLTGMNSLNSTLGRVYLQSLQASTKFEITVNELLEEAGFRSASPPTTIDALEATGIFETELTRALAAKILEYWYTGIYENAEGEQVVATYVDALTWVAISYTKPTTICGSPGFWAEPPQRDVF
jgi:hypothetical protein